MRTIKDVPYWNDWKALDWEDKLDITINTMFLAGKINVEEKFRVSDYGHAIIELSSLDDDDKQAQEG